MENLKHTAGQWEVSSNSNQGLRILINPNNLLKTNIICSVSGSPNDNEIKANAKLIAAAPKLLEALMHIVERINTVRPEDSFCQALKDTANEIIKKATE